MTTATSFHQSLSTLPNSQMGGWSFLQSLTIQPSPPPIADADVFVHPMVKQSKSTLSEKSLEMCTESLGSETGSDIDPARDIPSLPKTEPEHQHESVRAREVEAPFSVPRRPRGGVRGGVLPPPLSSLSGIKVETVREGGRLVMTAVTVGPTHACFEAERGNGRLRLRFNERCVLRCEGDVVGNGGEEDMEGIFEKVEGENGDNKYARASTSRCKLCNGEGSRNREMMNLKALFGVVS